MIGFQPAPACRDGILWDEYLEESLGASFTADESAVGFGERSGRQNQISHSGGWVVEVIERDDAVRSIEKGVDLGAGSAAIEIVFENDYSFGRPFHDRLECRAERKSADERRADTVAFRHRKTDGGVCGHGHIRGSSYDGLAGATDTGNHQRFFCIPERESNLAGERELVGRRRARIEG